MTTIKKKILINWFPFLIANFEPHHPPMALLMAIGIAIVQIIFPFKKNKQIEPKLVAKLTILALADACKKSKPKRATKHSTRKLPVPGPMNPS